MNIWKQFQQLQKTADLRVGEIISIDGAESVMQDAGGNQFRAIGTSVPVGSKAFVKDGIITGQAPDLANAGVHYV